MNSAVIFPHWHFLELFGGKRVSRIGQTRIKSVNQEMRNRNHSFSLLKNSTVTSRFWHFLEPFGGKRIGRIGQTRIKKVSSPVNQEMRNRTEKSGRSKRNKRRSAKQAQTRQEER